MIARILDRRSMYVQVLFQVRGNSEVLPQSTWWHILKYTSSLATQNNTTP